MKEMVNKMHHFLDSLFVSSELFADFKQRYLATNIEDIDRTLRYLIDNLNHVPGLVTIYSCSGLDREHKFKSNGYILLAVDINCKDPFSLIANDILKENINISITRPFNIKDGSRYGAWNIVIRSDWDIIVLNQIASKITNRKYPISLRHNLLMYLYDISKLNDEDFISYFGSEKMYYLLGDELVDANHKELLDFLRDFKKEANKLRFNNDISEAGKSIINKAMEALDNRYKANLELRKY